jgi:hypothetical protein
VQNLNFIVVFARQIGNHYRKTEQITVKLSQQTTEAGHFLYFDCKGLTGCKHR